MRVSELVEKLGLAFEGEDFEVHSFGTIKDANSSQVAFFENQKLLSELKQTKAGAVIIAPDFVKYLPEGITPILSDAPYLSMARASIYFAHKPFDTSTPANISPKSEVHISAVIGSGSLVEEGARIMPNVSIGANVKIGKNVTIFPNVVIYDDAIIKDRCIIHAGAVIGSDGFGYAHTKLGEHIKIYHNGNIILEEDVEIGANTTIDRAVFGTTLIKKGTKIDNLVQVGHNCEIGEACILVSQSGLAGSTKLGRNVIMGGQSATAGHLSIGDFAKIAARGGVTKSIDGGKTYSGFPLVLHSEWLKAQAKLARLFKKD